MPKMIKKVIKKMIMIVRFFKLKIVQFLGKKITICDVPTSLKLLNTTEKSLARFGDGELSLILGSGISFQKKQGDIAERLQYVLTHPIDNCFIGVPDAINNYTNITNASMEFWVPYMNKYRKHWVKLLSSSEQYLTTNVTRLYIRYKDKSQCMENFRSLMHIWAGKDILIVEGKNTALGVGNDLLSGARSIQRILCPSENAYAKYDEILEATKQNAANRIVLLALGPTATVMAYDLALAGIRALDIGHCDIEYEWCLRGVTEKVKIENKYVNEVNGGNAPSSIRDEEYNKQIIKVIN